MAAETRERILDTAERLFADSGFVSTSLRDITNEAGVNLAAVNYHFGSKEALLAAVLERRIRPVNDRRLALLDELESRAADGGPTLEQIVTAFISPPFQMAMVAGARSGQFLKLLSHLHSQANPEGYRLFVRQFREVRERFTASLQRALPEIDPDEVARRVMYIVGAMIYAMSPDEAFGCERRPNLERQLQSLIDFTAAGLAAPETLPARAPVAARGGRA